MKYLAIHNSLQAGAALSINNKIIGAISEERITRIKDHHTFHMVYFGTTETC